MRTGDGDRGLTGWLGTVLGTRDPSGLAHFYAEVLGGTPSEDDPMFCTLQIGDSSFYLGFQLEPDHVEPAWPAGSADQQMQMQLDIGVTNVEDAVEGVVTRGGRLAEHQPQDDVRVMFDPAGHPFCLYLDRDG